jgi:hypothetical protein
MTLDPNTYTFTTAANMIASQVTPKDNNRSVSGLGKKSVDKTKTDFVPAKKWRALIAEQQASIRAAPEIKKSQKQKSVLDRKDRKIKNLQKKVSALKRHANKEAEDDDDSDNDDVDANAGSAFGGREKKKHAKKRSKK